MAYNDPVLTAEDLSCGEPTMAFWPQNPFRAPCWRWLLARHRAKHGLRPPAWREGQWARLAFQMNQALLQDDSPETLCRLVEWNLAMTFAYQLWSDTRSMTKEIVEAFILAGATSDEIARRLCLQVEVVDAFTYLFYDVREKLQHKMYVFAHLIGPEWTGPPSRVRFATVLKAFGYNLGPYVVDALLGVYQRDVEPLRLGEIGSYLPVATGLDLTVKAAVAAKLIEVNERTAPFLLRLDAWIRERELEAPSSSEDQQQLREGIDRMLGDVAGAYAAGGGREVPDWLTAFVSPSR